MKREAQNALLWEQEGERDSLRPLTSKSRPRLLLTLLAALLIFALLAVVLSIPNGPEDVSFEYEALLKEVRYDADGHVTALLTTPVGLGYDELLVLVERGRKPVTPSGKTSYKKLEVGTLLFISVKEGTTLQPGTPPSIQADVVMVKSIQ